MTSPLTFKIIIMKTTKKQKQLYLLQLFKMNHDDKMYACERVEVILV